MKARRAILFLLAMSSLALAFDVGSYSNSVKNNVGGAGEVKQRLKEKLGYDPDSAANNPESIPDQNAANSINELLQAIQGASEFEFTCKEKRTVSVKVLYRCKWNENLFPTLSLCQQNCIEEGTCAQTPCYGTAYCQSLSGGYVCPFNMTQCNATPICPPGGSYNASTGKCEATPSRHCWFFTCWLRCSFGYTYNPSRNICEADPTGYSYSCPLGNYQCVEDSPGVAYCSPHSCSQSVNGTPYCMTGPISSEINANVVGMWWCSGDGTWLQTKEECLENCPYYDCSLDGVRYTGETTCKNACRREHECEVY